MASLLRALVCLSFLQVGTAMAEDRALIIGINKYAFLGAGGQLSGSVNDANLIRKLVIDQWAFKPNQIKMLLDEKASASSIISAIDEWLIKGTKTGDRAFLYYSGHGYFIPDRDGDEPDGKDEVLVAHDAKSVGREIRNVVDDDVLRSRLERISDRSTIVVVDSCHSGTITRALNPYGKSGPSIERFPKWLTTRGLDRADKSGVRQLTATEFDEIRREKNSFGGPAALTWTAVSPSEIAQEDVSGVGENRFGVFTRYFVEGLQSSSADQDRNGAVSAAELLQYVRSKSKAYCAKYKCSTGMTPTFEPGGKDLARDMLLWERPEVGSPDSTDPTDLLVGQETNTGAEISILPSASVKLGEEIKVRIKSSKAGYVFVLDVRDDGQVVQLFPSTCSHPNRKIRANVALTMPDAGYGCSFAATEPGTGKIMAVVSEDNVPLEQLLAKHKSLEVISNPSAYLASIADALLAVWTNDDRNRPVNWTITVANYAITSR